MEPDDSLKSSVENLIPSPNESKDLSKDERECDVPACDDFTIFSNLLFDVDDDFSSTDCDLEEEIRLIEKFLYDNSSPRPPKEFNSENSYAAIESFCPSLIPVEDSDSFRDEIDLSLTSNDSMPPGIEDDDYDFEGDILILEEFLSNDSLLLPENESFHFDIPSSPRPLVKPSDGNGYQRKRQNQAKTGQNQARNGKRGKVKSIKSMSNQSKPGTDLERAQKTKAEGVNILLGRPIPELIGQFGLLFWRFVMRVLCSGGFLGSYTMLAVCLSRQRVSVAQQRIRLYFRGKENGVNILKSIDEGPFQMGTFREILAEGEEGAFHLGPERPRVYSDLLPKDKERYNLYDDFEHFRQNKAETIHDYYVSFTKLINDMRNIKMTMPVKQMNSKFINNMLPEWAILIIFYNSTINICAGNKMHKAFPLPVIKFPLAEEFPTASEESSHCQKKRDATAKRIALLRTIPDKYIKHKQLQRLVGNKMHKAFPLPVIEFPLAEEVPTAREESSYCQKKRDATAKRIALLSKSQGITVIEFGDSYEVPASAATTEIASNGTGKKSERTVSVTTEDMKKRKNDVKTRTTLLMSLPNEHQL
nr:hypothetical protein [Tanacetum cinerariifolium]